MQIPKHLICDCGRTKKDDWHLLCVECWNRVPPELQTRVYDEYKNRRDSVEHLLAISEVRKALSR